MSEQHAAAIQAIEKALAFVRSLQKIEGTDKDSLEHFLEIAIASLCEINK